MRVKESVILALKTAVRDKSVLVVGREGRERRDWLILPLDDSKSDQLYDSIIVTPDGLRYPEDETRLAALTAKGL